MAVNFSLLNEKIRLEAAWNKEYADNGYSLALITLSEEINEIKKKMVSEVHAVAKREIKQPVELFATAS